MKAKWSLSDIPDWHKKTVEGLLALPDISTVAVTLFRTDGYSSCGVYGFDKAERESFLRACHCGAEFVDAEGFFVSGPN